MEIYGPPDVVAGVLAFFRARGVDARSRVPTQRETGMVRVSRVGGVAENAYQDQPRVLVEVWADSQPESFDLCRALWGMIAAIDTHDALPGLVTHHIEPATMPLQFPDDLAPDMDRHQFEIEAHVRMEPMTVPNILP